MTSAFQISKSNHASRVSPTARYMASNSPGYVVRPLSRPARSDFKDAFRIYLSTSSLLSLKLKPGDPCQIGIDSEPPKTAIAWSAAEKIQETVVQTSKTLQEIYGLKLGDKVAITVLNERASQACIVNLQPDISGSSDAKTDINERDKPHWEWFLEMPMKRAEWLVEGLAFDAELKGDKQRFKIVRIDAANTAKSTLFQWSADTQIKIAGHEPVPALPTSEPVNFLISKIDIGGLDRQLTRINRVLRRYGAIETAIELPQYYRFPRGLLLYGPKGTGKSLVTNCIAKCSWKKVFHITQTSGRESMNSIIEKAFADAVGHQPSLLVVDQIELLAPKRSSFESQNGANNMSALRQGFENIGNNKVLVVAETRHPNEIDEALRALDRFGVEVEITVPSANDRLAILKAIRGKALEPSEALLQEMSERTHGYVGADLVALIQICVELAEDRLRSVDETRPSIFECADENIDENGATTNEGGPITFQILDTDVSGALALIRPTALQEIFLSTPHTPWSSIGGYSTIKEHLQTTVTRPLKFPDEMARLNLRPRKGLLLYGPPGCSKTLLVKALATESGLNFLAVKGAEVLSMYVGESERSVREIFRKARAASPSIIFFDEIDAIASPRGAGGTGGNSGVNVLTTLLNELDGIEELRNVLIVAATNVPHNIDPALLRPGRLDHLLYVGPPDAEAREEILAHWLGKSQVSDDMLMDHVIGEVAASTNGYSGAEIIGICETAGGYAMDRLEQSKQMSGDEPGISEETGRIERSDFDRAVKTVRRGITKDSIQLFEEWGSGTR